MKRDNRNNLNFWIAIRKHTMCPGKKHSTRQKSQQHTIDLSRKIQVLSISVHKFQIYAQTFLKFSVTIHTMPRLNSVKLDDESY